ncbi:hypothetical protein GH714_026620 [Hevea brasiliensis]|uniref:Uncharacterized protein n=1 Tax=Hevea brasiliensis TaxID=3981 RepID=A0A6A6LUW3_HEVBR|nr:hypothetical protein GH714_026577 [Hevea brasiliensis]KAF2304043.1 hypothetical protein GH714_026620 [Hevea brasiliensis]
MDACFRAPLQKNQWQQSVPNIGFVPLLSPKKRLEIGFPRKMAWSQEKCNADVENKLEVVRPRGLPATEVYSEEVVEAFRGE